MARTLDRTRKFSTTYGEDHRRYLQDGVYFGADGKEIGAVAGTVAAAAPKPAPKPAPTPAAPPAPAGTGDPDASGSEEARLKAHLATLNFGQTKALFTKAGGPAELTKGAGAVKRMAEWLVANSSLVVEAPPPA